MAGKAFRWTPEKIAGAVATLREHSHLADALPIISRLVGFPVTRSGLDCAFANRGMSTPASHLDLNRPRTTMAVETPSSLAEEIPVDWDDETEPHIVVPVLDHDSPPAVTVKAPAEQTRDELELLRVRRENADLSGARKRLLADLSDRDEQIAILRELRAARPLGPIVAAKKVGGMQRQGVPVMLCSDWHIEEPVDPKTVNGLNLYNLDVADACITRMAEAYEWFLRDSRFDCRAGVVWLGGDLYSGYIHEELVEANFLSPTQAVLWLQERIERMLRTIAATCPQLERIIVPCNDGNHGRMTHKIRVSTRTANSLEWLLYQTLAAKLADDPRFEFVIADGEWTFVDVFARRVAFTHGDSFSYGGGVGGISIPIRRGIARQFQHQRADYFNIGHFHQRSDFGDIAVNGSMIGYNGYAQRIHAAPEPRQQTWYLLDSEKGKAFTAPIWLPQHDERRAA